MGAHRTIVSSDRMCGADGRSHGPNLARGGCACVFIFQAVSTPSKEVPLDVCVTRVCNSFPALDPALSVCWCVFTSPGTERVRGVNSNTVSHTLPASMNTLRGTLKQH